MNEIREGTPLSMTNQSAAAVDASTKPNLGLLPAWNLGDLYPAMDSPALKRDLETADDAATTFQKRWRGRLADIDFEPIYQRVTTLSDLEPGAFTPDDIVLHRGTGSYHKARR